MAESEHGQDDQELVFKETVEDLRSLIIYAKATSIKPWSWERQKATNVTQIFSFGEPTAIELCTSWNKGVSVMCFSFNYAFWSCEFSTLQSDALKSMLKMT